jgi:hypothetical protein
MAIKAKMKKEIIKLQVSIYTTESKSQVLIYNKDRSIFYQEDITPEIEDLMDGDKKAYFEAHIDETNKLVLDKQIDEQNW